MKSAKDIVTSALQSIEGDDDDTTPSTGGVTGGGDSKKETNTTKQDMPPQTRSENVKKDGDKPSRHATENDPYSPPTFPPTLNEAIKGKALCFMHAVVR